MWFVRPLPPTIRDLMNTRAFGSSGREIGDRRRWQTMVEEDDQGRESRPCPHPHLLHLFSQSQQFRSEPTSSPRPLLAVRPLPHPLPHHPFNSNRRLHASSSPPSHQWPPCHPAARHDWAEAALPCGARRAWTRGPRTTSRTWTTAELRGLRWPPGTTCGPHTRDQSPHPCLSHPSLPWGCVPARESRGGSQRRRRDRRPRLSPPQARPHRALQPRQPPVHPLLHLYNHLLHPWDRCRRWFARTWRACVGSSAGG